VFRGDVGAMSAFLFSRAVGTMFASLFRGDVGAVFASPEKGSCNSCGFISQIAIFGMNLKCLRFTDSFRGGIVTNTCFHSFCEGVFE
jgi:hypothetical protein